MIFPVEKTDRDENSSKNQDRKAPAIGQPEEGGVLEGSFVFPAEDNWGSFRARRTAKEEASKSVPAQRGPAYAII